MYISLTRLDISYVVEVVSRFMHLPQVPHMDAVMRIFKYLKGTRSRGVFFKKNDHPLVTQKQTRRVIGIVGSLP